VKTEGKRKVTYSISGQKWGMYILLYMANVVDFGEHSNNEIQRTVLPRTESGYKETLLIFAVCLDVRRNNRMWM
jgi:hypothetical protein